MNDSYSFLTPASGPGASSAAMAEATHSPSKLASSAKEFESILLSSWLQSAEASFGSVPGADDVQDGSTSQITDFGAQQLAKAWSDAGGVGLAKQVTHALEQSKRQESSAMSGSGSVSR